MLKIPALIDPHVHFRTPGHEYKENWESGARAAIYGGVTTIFDMPNNVPACVTRQALLEKVELIDRQLKKVAIPLRYKLYFGADRDHLDEIPKIANLDVVAGVKIFMGSSTGTLLVDDEPTLSKVFHLAAEHDLLIAVHAEKEELIEPLSDETEPSVHSKKRGRGAAIAATELAISLAKQYGTKLAILHLSTKEELKLVENAKKEGVKVFAETSPHHLFLDENDYEKWGTFVQVNPPLRTEEDRIALWEGVRSGAIDWIGTDHAPHLKKEKEQGYGRAPSGIPSIELYLPLLLDACHRGFLTIERLIEITSTRVQEVFSLPKTEDYALIDQNEKREVTNEMLHTKCAWSPYAGRVLTGWPIETCIRNQRFILKETPCLKR